MHLQESIISFKVSQKIEGVGYSSHMSWGRHIAPPSRHVVPSLEQAAVYRSLRNLWDKILSGPSALQDGQPWDPTRNCSSVWLSVTGSTNKGSTHPCKFGNLRQSYGDVGGECYVPFALNPTLIFTERTHIPVVGLACLSPKPGFALLRAEPDCETVDGFVRHEDAFSPVRVEHGVERT